MEIFSVGYNIRESIKSSESQEQTTTTSKNRQKWIESQHRFRYPRDSRRVNGYA